MITINLQSPPLKLLLTILLLLLIIPQTTLSKSGIYTESRAFCHNTNTTEPDTKTVLLKYKAGSVAAILVCGGIGVTLPLLGHKIPALKPENDVFFMIKAFAAGVILATSFIHILPEAFRDLTSPCLVEISSIFGSFPFAGFVAMCSSIGTLMVDSFATGFCKRQQRKQIVDADDVERSGDGDDRLHVRVSVSAVGNRDLSSSEIIRRRIVSQVLELGILVHSLVIGISLGASNTVEVIKPLLVALSFHQFFEGLGLGGCIAQAKFESKSTAIMAVFFSLTTPIGIGIGMAISRIYRENSSTAILVEGILNSTSSGILIYMALVDLLAADFMNPKLLNNFRILLGANVSLVLGASCMSVLAIWT